MIGHYLLTLTPEQEDRLLTETLAPGGLVNTGGRRCLLGVVEDWRLVEGFTTPGSAYEMIMNLAMHVKRHDERKRLIEWSNDSEVISVPERFDALCYRFHTPRITRAVRNRILSNQARRTLTRAPELVAVEV